MSLVFFFHFIGKKQACEQKYDYFFTVLVYSTDNSSVIIEAFLIQQLYNAKKKVIQRTLKLKFIEHLIQTFPLTPDIYFDFDDLKGFRGF